MCIAIYKLKGNDVPCEEYLKNSWEENPDGAGFAFNDNGNVRIVKGLMTWETFKETFDKYNKKYGFKDRGLLIHFRIQTHGGINPECTHPFPISSDEGALQKTMMVSPYAVIHNGIISLTSADARTKEKMSDTMVFIQKYLTKIASNKKWFYNPANFELIYDLIDSKIAVLNGRGDINCTYGFTKDEKDGNFYSNTSYKYGRTKWVSVYPYSYDSYYRGMYSDGDWDYVYTKDGFKKREEVSVKEVGTNTQKSGIVVPLMRLQPGDIVMLDDGTEYAYEEDMAAFIDEYGQVFYCDPPKSTWVNEELFFTGSGVFVNAMGTPIDFEPDYYTDEENLGYEDDSDYCEIDFPDETDTKENETAKDTK